MRLHLTTTRLDIEPLRADDVPAFVGYRQEPDVARWQSWDTDYSPADGLALVAAQPAGDLPEPGDWLQLAVRDRSTGELFGDVAVHLLAAQPDTSFSSSPTLDAVDAAYGRRPSLGTRQPSEWSTYPGTGAARYSCVQKSVH